MSLPAPFAFGFTSIPMLAWLAAAAAPILIHLWSRQRYRAMSWAAMEYLLAAMKRQSRRLRFEQLLLLIVRTLVILLVVLAVAEPYFEEVGFVPVSGGRTHRVLVIDGSYSMNYRSDETSRFDRAKQLAGQIVRESRQGDAFTLVLMASPSQVIVGTPALEPGEILKEIEKLTPVHTAANVHGTLTKVHQIVRNATKENPGLTQHEVYFLTDLGQMGWDPKKSRFLAAEFRRRAQRLCEVATLVVLDVAEKAADNLAVTSLTCSRSVVVAGETVDFTAVVQNFGDQAVSDQAVELFVDGRQVEQQAIDLPSASQGAANEKGTVLVDFSYRFELPGDYAVEVRAIGDHLETDNHRWLAIPVRQEVRALCIDGRPSGEPLGGAADYLAAALSPGESPMGPAPVRVDVISENRFRESDLADYDCVFLCDVAQFTASEARRLDAYLKSGGSLIFFLGEQVLLDQYNRVLFGELDEEGRILPAELTAKVDRKILRLDPQEYRHPILAHFKHHERAGLISAPVWRYVRLAIPEGSTARVVLAGGGDPLIVEESVHRGHVILVATSADPSWTDLCVFPGFPPLVRNMAAFAASGQSRQRNIMVGQSIGGTIAAQDTKTSLTVHGPDGLGHDIALHREGDYETFQYDETMTGGMYTASFGPPVQRTQHFAVNVDAAESDLAHLAVERLRENIWADVPFLYQTTWQTADETPVSPLVRSTPLHAVLLYAVLALLFVETFLAWRFGYHAG